MENKIDEENKKRSIQFNKEGVKLYSLEKYQESIDKYDQAIKLDPKYVQAYNNKGYSLYKLQRYQEAIEMFDQTIKLDPKFAVAYNNKGLSLFYIQRNREALDIEFLLCLGYSLDSQKKYQEAIDMFDEAIKLEPKYVQAYNNKGNSLKIMGQQEYAKKTFKECLKIDPNNQYAKSQLGLYFYQGNRQIVIYRIEYL